MRGLLPCLFAAVALAADVPAPAGRVPRVLVLNSYHPGYNWSDGEQSALLHALVRARPELLPAVEYLDWRRYPDPARRPALLGQLAQKYGSRHFDLIVALDEPALELVLGNRDRFGPEVPVVFGGINDADPAALGRHARLTGVAQTYDFGGTLDLIGRLQPQLRRLVAVHCRSESGLATRRAFERHLAARPAPWPIEWKDDDWSGPELLESLEKLPAGSAVLVLSVFRDRLGHVLADDGDFGRELARRCAVPAYFVAPPIVRHFGDASWETASWPGVGGSLLAPDLHGEAAAALAVRVLNGEPIERIPIVERSPSRIAVNYPLLVRFGLDEAALPPGTVVYAKPVTFFRRHRGEIWVAVVLCVVFGAIIAGLVWQVLVRRRTARTLRASQLALETAQRAAHLGSWSVDLATQHAEWSAEMFRLFERDPAAGVPGFPEFLELVHPQDRAMVRRVYEQTLAGARETKLEFRRLRGDRVRYYFGTNQLTCDEHGAPVRVSGTTQDITRRCEAELQARTGEVRLRSILDAMFVLVGLFTPDGVLIEVNRAPLEMIGARREDVLGRHFTEIPWLADSTDAVREQFRRMITRAAGGELVRDDVMISGGPGRLLPVDAMFSPLRDAAGKVTAVITSAVDITARKQAETELQRLNHELEERVTQRTTQLAAKNKELESFTYAVSHDLKAPLRGVDGYSRLLLEDHADQLDDEGRQFLVNVRNAADQMGRLIDDLLSYSKLERRAIEQAVVDPARFVENLLGDYATEIANRPVAVHAAVASVPLVADPQGLLMALRNLLDNALKFTRHTPRPVVTISGATRGDRYVLAVRDNGPGFDPKFSERIFEIFQRLHRAEEFPGTGVGLAIVRKAMERMGGRAWATSVPGERAEFFLELPVAPAAPVSPPSAV